jgi:ferredoxin
LRRDPAGTHPIISPDPVGADLEAHARRAVAECPLLALKLERRADRD